MLFIVPHVPVHAHKDVLSKRTHIYDVIQAPVQKHPIRSVCAVRMCTAKCHRKKDYILTSIQGVTNTGKFESTFKNK